MVSEQVFLHLCEHVLPGETDAARGEQDHLSA
jgi:hypothetical protein